MKREITDPKRAEEDRKVTHIRLVDTLESMTDGFVSLDKNWHYTYVNRRAAELFGRTPEELIGKHIWTEFPEGIGQRFYHNYYKAVQEQKPIVMEEYYPPWNRWFENRIYPTKDGLSIFFQEITERKRAELIVSNQNQLLEMIASGRPLVETMTALILFIESQAAEMLCSIVLLDEDGKKIRHLAAPSLPREFMQAIDGAAIGPSAGSCGTAAHRGEAVIVEDIATDPLWANYYHLALPHNLRACWSTPIFDEAHHVLGTFAVYYRKPATPDSFHLRLIEIATHIASISISRNRDEEILRRSEQQLGLIYDTVNDVIFLLEVQANDRYRFVSVNHAFLLATGLNAGQIVGKYVEEVLPPSAHEMVFPKYRIAIQEKRTIQWEEVSVYPSGKKIAIVKVNPVFDERGVCTNLVGAVHDITEFREAEEAVRKSQEELEHIYKTAPVGLALVDENLRYLRMNEELAAMYGRPAEELLGQTVREILPEFAPKLEAVYRKVLESGQPVRDVEVHGTTPPQPGRERDWTNSYFPLISGDGKVRGVNVVVREITDRAATSAFGQLALGDMDVEGLFRVALDIVAKTLGTPYVIVFELMPDSKSLIPRASQGWTVEVPRVGAGSESLAGYTMSIGEPLVIEDLRNETRFGLPQHLLQQKIISSMTVVIPGKKAPYGILGAYSTNRREFNPPETHFLQSVANILGTVIERKRLEEQIFQTQKLELIGSLAAGVAHQLNTPLAVIMMRLQMLKEDLATIEQKAPLGQVDGILSAAKKMSTIIQDLLNFSRLPELKKEKVQIEFVLQQILSFVEVRARKQHVELQQNFSDNIPAFDADKNRLEQALLNIVVNALDAMPEGGTLSVSTAVTTQAEMDYLRIEFRDNGSGMTADETGKIFDPFFTTKPVGQGTGLGLSVTYEIIRSHGGEIKVISEKGDGSTFHVLIPLSSSDPES
jgi:PAS domain S-box-containing protein